MGECGNMWVNARMGQWLRDCANGAMDARTARTGKGLRELRAWMKWTEANSELVPVVARAVMSNRPFTQSPNH